jgi:hypothetical protein
MRLAEVIYAARNTRALKRQEQASRLWRALMRGDLADGHRLEEPTCSSSALSTTSPRNRRAPSSLTTCSHSSPSGGSARDMAS